jgi:hypothetical protein
MSLSLNNLGSRSLMSLPKSVLRQDCLNQIIVDGPNFHTLYSPKPEYHYTTIFMITLLPPLCPFSNQDSVCGKPPYTKWFRNTCGLYFHERLQTSKLDPQRNYVFCIE